jgi:pheromone alpha factor receptor
MDTPVAQPVQGPWVITYSNAGIDQSNSSFYYHDQTVHWLANYGGFLVNVTLAEIDATNYYNAAVALNYGAQAGGCAVMFFVVLVLSNATKRRTPIYILNILSLFFGFLRGLFYALYNISAWVQLYPYYTDDFSAIPRSAYAVSVAATIWPLLMTVTVNLSLVLQSYTVTKNMLNSHRYAVIATSTLVFLLATGFRFAVTVANCESIVGARVFDSVWVQKGALYMETVSIWFFSIIFTSKLVYTLYYRRKHGWKQWSGVKILAAMGGCTMLIPCKSCILILDRIESNQ